RRPRGQRPFGPRRTRPDRHAGAGRRLRRLVRGGTTHRWRVPRRSAAALRRTRVIRVAVADDQALVRSGFAVLLRSADGIDVVGEAADGREAVELAQRTSPDVILM